MTGGPELYRIVKREQPGTGFWPILPITINGIMTFVAKITKLMYEFVFVMSFRMK